METIKQRIVRKFWKKKFYAIAFAQSDKKSFSEVKRSQINSRCSWLNFLLYQRTFFSCRHERDRYLFQLKLLHIFHVFNIFCLFIFSFLKYPLSVVLLVYSSSLRFPCCLGPGGVIVFRAYFVSKYVSSCPKYLMLRVYNAVLYVLYTMFLVFPFCSLVFSYAIVSQSFILIDAIAFLYCKTGFLFLVPFYKISMWLPPTGGVGVLILSVCKLMSCLRKTGCMGEGRATAIKAVDFKQGTRGDVVLPPRSRDRFSK